MGEIIYYLCESILFLNQSLFFSLKISSSGRVLIIKNVSPRAFTISLLSVNDMQLFINGLRHTAEDDAPVVDKYVPALHELHAVNPVVAAYIPTLQLMQLLAPAANAKVPTAQLMQVEARVAPTVTEALPAGHEGHAVDDVTAA